MASCASPGEMNRRGSFLYHWGQKQTFTGQSPMSALPPKANIAKSDWHVRFVMTLFDHFVGAGD
jgi:hypothetical protein